MIRRVDVTMRLPGVRIALLDKDHVVAPDAFVETDGKVGKQCSAFRGRGKHALLRIR
jgi:hypothetical protein